MDQAAFEEAIRRHWKVRFTQAAKQVESGRVDAGLRGAVTGGAHLNDVVQVFADLFIDVGLPRSAVRQSTGLELPGFYRPTKKWDLVVIDHGVLIAAIEFKSQVGPSFGNNFNNRIEEAIGSATDVRRAYEEGAFGSVRLWLGYVFLLEETTKSTTPVRINPTAFAVDSIFDETSYLDRYRILCQRLVEGGLYDAACFVAASADPGQPVYEPDPELSFVNFAAAIAKRTAFVKALERPTPS